MGLATQTWERGYKAAQRKLFISCSPHFSLYPTQTFSPQFESCLQRFIRPLGNPIHRRYIV